MSAEVNQKIEAFKSQVQVKIQKSLTEFAEGRLSREQFHAIYQHYTNQLDMAEQALRVGDADLLDKVSGATIGIRNARMGMALGVVVYHNKTGTLVDTLGEFDVPPTRISPVLNDFSLLMDANKFIEPRVEKVSATQWLLFVPGNQTTIVTLFKNEPSPQQIREIERLHHDFEMANRVLLASTHVDASKLAYPFLVFVRQKLSSR